MIEQSQIEINKRERFEQMAVRVANHLNMSSADRFDQLPEPIKKAMNTLTYIELVMPLMKDDRDAGASFRQLEIKYGVPKSTIQDYFTGYHKRVSENQPFFGRI